MKKIVLILMLLGSLSLSAFECEVDPIIDQDCSIAGEDGLPPYGPALKKTCSGTWF